MIISSAGLVGIGTSSPATTLDIRSPNIAIGVTALSTAQGQAFVGTTNNWGQDIGGTLALGGAQNSGTLTQTFASIAGRRESSLGYIYTGYMQLAVSDGTNMVEAMRITSTGNVGIGVTPSGWSSAYTAIQFPNGGSISGYKASVAAILELSANQYYDGAYKYVVSSYATRYAQNQGTHAWYTALSGTAGDAITFTNVANLNSDSLYVYVGVNPSSNGVTSARIFNSSTGASTTTLYVGNAAITTVSDLRLKENVVDSQRNALELLGQLRVVDHTWNDPSDQCENNRNSRGTWMGLIAQEAQLIIPWIVNKPTADVDENGDPQYWHMDYGYSVPLLVKAIQEQQALIESLTTRLTALENK